MRSNHPASADKAADRERSRLLAAIPVRGRGEPMIRKLRFALAFALVVILFWRNAIMAAPIPPEVKSVVAFLFIPGKQPGELVPYGTAFFVGVKDPKNPDRSFVYLVTAKHVLRTPDRKTWLPKIFLRLNTKTSSSEIIEISLFLSGAGRTVFMHSDPSVDIAVIPALPDQDRFDFKVLPEEMITTEKDFKGLGITEGSEVFFTGLFSPYVGTRKNYPVVRFGRVSLITDEKIKFVDDEAQLYLIESGSYGGNSGSPVFFYLGSDRTPGMLVVGPPILKLAGVMSGSFLDLQPVGVVETARVNVAPSSMGIAAVVPAYKLHDLLFSADLMKQRGQ